MTSIALERSDNIRTLKVKPAIQRIALQVNARQPIEPTDHQILNFSWLGFACVVLGHVALIVMIAMHQTPSLPRVAAKPMMVSLIAPPAPEPALVPVVEPPKPEPKPKTKPTPKKVVQEVKPVEVPAPVQVEAATEPEPVEEAPKPVVADTVAEAPQAPPKPAPMIEEKIEPPRFGVAYLNNPQPVYPSLSRRMGEEGRVLMRVLVGSDGSAKTVDVEESSGSERLDNAAVNAVKKWRFVPARKNNQPLDAFVLVPMKFSLNS